MQRLNQLLGRNPTVMVVDDEEDLLLVISMVMKKEGFEVILSLNANDLFIKLESKIPDVILMDIRMNGVDGATLCKHIKNDPLTHNIPVLMFSANRNIAKIAKDCKADGYLAKPFDLDELAKKMEAIIRPH